MKTTKFALDGKHKCQNCGQVWDADDLPDDIEDIYQRVEPGEPIPSGECPDCGALCQPVKELDADGRALAYMETNDGCPNCHDFTIGGGLVAVDGNEATQDVECSRCGAKYKLTFTLSAVETISEGEDDEEDGGEWVVECEDK